MVDNNPCATGICRLLSKTSLDELPQSINVLKGGVSIVGPRPIADGELGYCGSLADEFLYCKPGIVGGSG